MIFEVASAQPYENYLKTRNFDTSPIEQLEELKKDDFIRSYIEGLERYLDLLHIFKVDEALLTRIQHAVVSFIYLQLQKGRKDGIQYLMPPIIDPYTTMVKHSENEDYLIRMVAMWEAENSKETKSITDIVVRRMLKEKKAKSLLFIGSMFGEKTLTVLEIIKKLKDSGPFVKTESNPNPKRVIGFIAASMDEPYIMTRLGNRDSDDDFEQVYKMKAEAVDFESFKEKIAELDLDSGEVIVIDEAMFLAWNQEDSLEVLHFFESLNARGIWVLGTGLITDFLARNLAMYEALLSAKWPSIEHLELNGWFAKMDKKGQGVVTGNGKTITGRSHLTAFSPLPRFFDFAMPVPVGRVHAFVEYFVCPEEDHPTNVLEKEDRECFQELIKHSGVEKLRQIYFFIERQLKALEIEA